MPATAQTRFQRYRLMRGAWVRKQSDERPVILEVGSPRFGATNGVGLSQTASLERRHGHWARCGFPRVKSRHEIDPTWRAALETPVCFAPIIECYVARVRTEEIEI